MSKQKPRLKPIMVRVPAEKLIEIYDQIRYGREHALECIRRHDIALAEIDAMFAEIRAKRTQPQQQQKGTK